MVKAIAVPNVVEGLPGSVHYFGLQSQKHQSYPGNDRLGVLVIKGLSQMNWGL